MDRGGAQDPPKKKKRIVKYMRLRCKFKPLHDAYFVGGKIVERDTDVVFKCQDGVLRAHKIILILASKFFTDIFKDQKCGKMTEVLVPDIDLLTMQLILKLAYRDQMNISMKRIKDVGEYLTMFGMEWENFSFVEKEGRNLGNVVQIPGISKSDPLSLNDNFPDRKKESPTRSYPAKRTRTTRFKNTPRRGKQTPESDEDYVPVAPPDAEKMIKDWMKKVGKADDDSGDELVAPRRVIPPQNRQERQEWRAWNPGPSYTTRHSEPKNKCFICNFITDDVERWKWHESVHADTAAFRCNFCGKIFDTERKVLFHEVHTHNYKCKFEFKEDPQNMIYDDGEDDEEEEEEVGNASKRSKQMNDPNMIKVQTANGIHYRRRPQVKAPPVPPVQLSRTKSAFVTYANRSKSADSPPQLKKNTRRRASGDNDDTKIDQNQFPPVACPICGGKTQNIVAHLARSHSDFKIRIMRVSENAVRCQDCRTSFALCDLITHACDQLSTESSSRGGGSEEGDEGKRKELAQKDAQIDQNGFGAVRCIICDKKEVFVKNYVEHLKGSHPEFLRYIKVLRINEDEMRCQKCFESFPIGQLLLHVCYEEEEVGGGDGDGGQDNEERVETDLGCAPIDRILLTPEDLVDIRTIRKTFDCASCHKKGRTMAEGADCLKTHGIHRCIACFNTYDNRENYSLHLRKVHTIQNGKMICPCCPHESGNAGQLKLHMVKVHWNPLFETIVVEDREMRKKNYSPDIVSKFEGRSRKKSQDQIMGADEEGKRRKLEEGEIPIQGDSDEEEEEEGGPPQLDDYSVANSEKVVQKEKEEKKSVEEDVKKGEEKGASEKGKVQEDEEKGEKKNGASNEDGIAPPGDGMEEDEDPSDLEKIYGETDSDSDSDIEFVEEFKKKGEDKEKADENDEGENGREPPPLDDESEEEEEKMEEGENDGEKKETDAQGKEKEEEEEEGDESDEDSEEEKEDGEKGGKKEDTREIVYVTRKKPLRKADFGLSKEEGEDYRKFIYIFVNPGDPRLEAQKGKKFKGGVPLKINEPERGYYFRPDLGYL